MPPTRPERPPAPPRISRRRLLESWWLLPVASSAAAFAWLGERAWRIRFGKPPAGPPAFLPRPAVRVAALSDLPSVWDAREFELPAGAPGAPAATPAVLVRVPRPQPGGLSVADRHFLAVSRVCTHLGCLTALVRDPEVSALAYNYRPPEGQPVLGCACHFSAFDLLQGGRSVAGPAIRPLPRLRLRQQAGALVATGIEPS